MLRIDRATYDAIVAHARADHPDEACGVVAGPEGSDRPERFIPMLNAARSPTFYEFDSADLLSLYKEMQRIVFRTQEKYQVRLGHKPNADKLAEKKVADKLRDAEIYEKTSPLVDKLYHRLIDER